jgi:hypothetical protein
MGAEVRHVTEVIRHACPPARAQLAATIDDGEMDDAVWLVTLIDQQTLTPGDELTATHEGLAVAGIRYATPKETAVAAGVGTDDGWDV